MSLSSDEKSLLLCSHDCTFSEYDIEHSSEYEIDHTHDYDRWFTCSDWSASHECRLVSDNKGYVHIFDSRAAGRVASLQLHKSNKISCVSLNTCGSVFATASNDRTSRIFDLRALSSAGYRSEIAIYSHDGVVSSSYFSPLGTGQLLTTAQNDDIRVYDVSEAGELISPRIVISHSHKFYQHISIIKAVWHPVQKHRVLVGRYDLPRGLDILNLPCRGSNLLCKMLAALMHQLYCAQTRYVLMVPCWRVVPLTTSSFGKLLMS
jgi:DNA damage-binding protein 2